MFLLAEPYISAEVDYRRERALGGRSARASRLVRRRRAAPRVHRSGLLRRPIAVGR
jgi:hypothetical protein